MNGEARKKPVCISQIVIKILSYAVLICGCLMVLIPIVVILLGAFKDGKEFANTGVFELPKSFCFRQFQDCILRGQGDARTVQHVHHHRRFLRGNNTDRHDDSFHNTAL